MVRGKKSIRRTSNSRPSVDEAVYTVSCDGCAARERSILLLERQLLEMRGQMNTAHEKLLSLVPTAMDSFSRLELSREARGKVSSVVQDARELVDDRGVNSEMDYLFGGLNGGRND